MQAPSVVAARLAREHNLTLDEVRAAVLLTGDPFHTATLRGALGDSAEEDGTLDELRAWAQATTTTPPG